uniref:Protein RER1 n=1 Tax=Aegilops tauschii subsp. strangulata TaxID=200361 RepID=A0A453DMT3_AEGTS
NEQMTIFFTLLPTNCSSSIRLITPGRIYRVQMYAITKAFVIAFVMTFFSVFDVPVFWPILLCYWIVLFVLTMKRQILHMVKYKYVPFNIGKQKYGRKKGGASSSSSKD